MKFSRSAIILAATLAPQAQSSCAADDCLRALRATQTPGHLQAARSFCATFTQNITPAIAIPLYAAVACTGNASSRISSACSCIGASSSSSLTTTRITSTSTAGPCATVSSLVAAAFAASPLVTPTVAAKLAHDCLNTVPLHVDEAIELVDAMEPYLEWQSDSAYKKSPTADYFYPPHDIFGKLASVKSNLQNNIYANEYQFQEDRYQVFALAHDGHFVFYPDALTKAFQWGRKHSLVSISSDGIQIPKIFVYADVIANPSVASAVIQVNGIDAATYVADFAYTASLNQDPDAAYNSMFFEKASFAAGGSSGYFAGGGRVRYIYPGDDTTFSFENGTIITLENIAFVKAHFTGVTDGESFYQKFCTGSDTSNANVISSTSAEDSTILTPGYPTPVITTNDTIISGYYLESGGYDDVAVISVLAFESESVVEFQAVAQTFLVNAILDGKTKLVIDLSANGGGFILQGYDLFRQLFPQIIQDGYSRFRENEAFIAISEIFSGAIPADYDPESASDNLIEEFKSPFNFRYDLNLTNGNFETFEDKFAPHIYKGDNFTNILRWNINDPLTTSNATYGLGINVTGYGSRTNFTQPFAAESITMLFDGFCASTCTLFSEFMRTQAGVKSIAMGGRPSTNPIQGVGGIKGAELFTWSNIYEYAQMAFPQGTPEQQAVLSKLTYLPIRRSLASGINVRDSILPTNLNDGLPAQYVVEEADCRLFFAQDMVLDVTKVWEAAAEAASGKGRCIYGSLSKRKVTELQWSDNAVPGGARRNVLLERAVKLEKDTTWAARHGKKVIV